MTSSYPFSFPSSSAVGFVLRLVVLSFVLVVQRTRQDDVSTATVANAYDGPLSTPTGSTRSFVLSRVGGSVSKATERRRTAATGVNKSGAATSDVMRYVMDDPPTTDNASGVKEEEEEEERNGTTTTQLATGGSTVSSSPSSAAAAAFQVFNSSGMGDGIVDWIRFYSRSSAGNGSDSTNETRTYYSSTLVEDDDEERSSEDGGSPPDGMSAGEEDAIGNELRPSGKPCRPKERRVEAREREASAETEAEDDYSLYDNGGGGGVQSPEVGEGTANLDSSQNGSEGEEEEEGEVDESEEEEGMDGERGLRDCTGQPVRRNGSTTVRVVEGVEDDPQRSPNRLHQTTEAIDQELQPPIPAQTGNKRREQFDSEQPLVVLHSGNDSQDMDWLENGENGFVRTFCWLSLATMAMFIVIGSIRYRQEIVGGLKQIRLSFSTTRDRRHQKPMVEEANTLLSHAQV